jgi:hypothetical protein
VLRPWRGVCLVVFTGLTDVAKPMLRALRPVAVAVGAASTMLFHAHVECAAMPAQPPPSRRAVSW